MNTLIITIVDYPNKDHRTLVRELHIRGMTVLTGDINELKKQTNEIKEKNSNAIVAWDYPTIIEDGYAHYSNKLLKIVYDHQLLTDEEKTLNEQRHNQEHHSYMISTPSSIQGNTEGWRKKELSMIVTISTYINDWRKQQKNESMTDEEMRKCSLNIFQKHGLEATSLCLKSDINASFLANYDYILNTINLNPVSIRKRHYGTEKDLTLIVAHELGHLVDPDIATLTKQKSEIAQKIKQATTITEIEEYSTLLEHLTLQAENNAYDNCYQFLNDFFSKEEVEEDRRRNEEAYKMRFKKEKDKRMNQLKKAQFYF